MGRGEMGNGKLKRDDDLRMATCTRTDGKACKVSARKNYSTRDCSARKT